MRHLNEVMEKSPKNGPAFSNGDQGYDWMSRWLQRRQTQDPTEGLRRRLPTSHGGNDR